MAKATEKKAAAKPKTRSAKSGSKAGKTAKKRSPAQKMNAKGAAAPAEKAHNFVVKTDSFIVRKEDAERGWWIVDATDQKVGRIATAVATLIRGKHKPTFTPHVDNGDFVVVINTDKLVMTGNKAQVKNYYRHSRFFGSLKAKSAEQYMKEDSTFVMREAVEGMLPNNKMGYALITKLKAYRGADHPHSAQKPQVYQLTRKG